MVLTRRGRSYETSVEPEPAPRAAPKAAPKTKAKPASAAITKARPAENKRTRRTRATKPDEASPLRSLENLPARRTNRVTKKKAVLTKLLQTPLQAQVDDTPEEEEDTGLFFDMQGKPPIFLNAPDPGWQIRASTRMRWVNRFNDENGERVNPNIYAGSPMQIDAPEPIQEPIQAPPITPSQVQYGFQPVHDQPPQIQGKSQQVQYGFQQVRGETHQVQGDNHPVQGDNHPVQGDNHPVQGDNHQVQGDSHQAQGDNYQIQGDNHQVQEHRPVHVPAWHRVHFELQGLSPSQHQTEFLKLKQEEEARENIDLYRPVDPTNIGHWATANAALRNYTDQLNQEIQQLRGQLTTKDYFLNNAIAENNTLKAENARLRRDRSPTPTPEVQNDPLLKKIIKARDEGRAAQYIKEKPQEQEVIVNGINGVDEEPENMDTTEDATPMELALTPAPVTVARSATSNSTGWGLSSLFSKVVSVFGSPANASPAKAPATAPTLAPQLVEEIGIALTPDTTPTRPAKHRPQPKAKAKTTKKRRKSDSARRAIVNQAVKGVQVSQKEVAEAWAKKVASKITASDANSPQPGMKRQALQQPMKIKDVKEIPARRPWEPTGSYGLLPEFFANSDDSDSESDDDEREVPGWYVVDTLANEQPPLKKRKTGSDASSINNTQSSLMSSPLSDTLGNSASLSDIHPRPSHIPSPMFENPVTHHDGGNVFEERKIQSFTVNDRAAFEKELRKNGHVEGSGTFCVPESDSDDDDDDGEQRHDPNVENAAGGLPWTQAPPAAPTPAHAELPVPVTASPSVPEIQSAPKTVAVDPVESARARAMKHTPAKPSRLREAMVPSPSLKSDAGSSPAVPAVVAAAAAQAQTISVADDMPCFVPLDLGNSQLLNSARSWTESAEFKDRAGKMFGGSNVTLVYDENDDDENDEDDDNYEEL